MAEVASFRPDDHPALVEASLSCPACLSGEVDWALETLEHDHQAHCRCRRCDHQRALCLNPTQALRLSLVPA